MQLGFYLLAAMADPELCTHGTPSEAELWMVALQNKTSLPVVEFDPGRIGEVQERLRAVAAGIAAEDWTPKPHEGCDRCPVQLVCPAWPQGARAYSP